jgi:hypothetical protein
MFDFMVDIAGEASKPQTVENVKNENVKNENVAAKVNLEKDSIETGKKEYFYV